MGAVATVTVSGKLVKDPDMRYTPGGQAVTKIVFPIDVLESKDGKMQKVDTFWIEASLWGKMAESANTNLRKGSTVAVTGFLSMKSWTRDDGQVQKTVVVNQPQIKYIADFGAEKDPLDGDAYGDQDAPF